MRPQKLMRPQKFPPNEPPLFHTVTVDRRVALRAWPLVQSSRPAARLEDWRAYAAALGRRVGKSAGLVAVEDEHGYIHALFAWHVHRAIGRPRELRVSDLVVGNLPGRELAQSIVVAIRRVATTTRADSVLVEIGDRQIAPDALLSDGFERLVMDCMHTNCIAPR
jgi:hypothetical protein